MSPLVWVAMVASFAALLTGVAGRIAVFVEDLRSARIRGSHEQRTRVVRHTVADPNTPNAGDFRANDGKVGGMLQGESLLLLHHVCARTGTERVTPLMYQAIPGGSAIFASRAGADTSPDEPYNVTANAQTTVEVGAESAEVSARATEGREHDDIRSRRKSEWPQFAEYEEKTARDVIPVALLERT